MVSVPASELQKNFGEWHDKALVEPIAITRYGRTSAYLMSSALFDRLWACFENQRQEKPKNPHE